MKRIYFVENDLSSALFQIKTKSKAYVEQNL